MKKLIFRKIFISLNILASASAMFDVDEYGGFLLHLQIFCSSLLKNYGWRSFGFRDQCLGCVCFMNCWLFGPINFKGLRKDSYFYRAQWGKERNKVLFRRSSLIRTWFWFTIDLIWNPGMVLITNPTLPRTPVVVFSQFFVC